MNELLLLVSGRMSITIYYIILCALGYDRRDIRLRALSDKGLSYDRARLVTHGHTSTRARSYMAIRARTPGHTWPYERACPVIHDYTWASVGSYMAINVCAPDHACQYVRLRMVTLDLTRESNRSVGDQIPRGAVIQKGGPGQTCVRAWSFVGHGLMNIRLALQGCGICLHARCFQIAQHIHW